MRKSIFWSCCTGVAAVAAGGLWWLSTSEPPSCDLVLSHAEEAIGRVSNGQKMTAELERMRGYFTNEAWSNFSENTRYMRETAVRDGWIASATRVDGKNCAIAGRGIEVTANVTFAVHQLGPDADKEIVLRIKARGDDQSKLIALGAEQVQN